MEPIEYFDLYNYHRKHQSIDYQYSANVYMDKAANPLRTEKTKKNNTMK